MSGAPDHLVRFMRHDADNRYANETPVLDKTHISDGGRSDDKRLFSVSSQPCPSAKRTMLVGAATITDVSLIENRRFVCVGVETIP
jgi:hypothetical protein